MDHQAAHDHEPEGPAEPSAPTPTAIGTAPATAASVVITIGRNRSRLASWMPGRPVAGLDAVPREVHDHDAVLHDAHQMNMPTNA